MARQYDRLRLTRVPAKYGPLMHRYPYLTSYPFRSQLDLMTDIPRLRMGMMGGQFWYHCPPLYVRDSKEVSLQVCVRALRNRRPTRSEDNESNRCGLSAGRGIKTLTRQNQIILIRRNPFPMIPQLYPDVFQIATTSQEVLQAFHQGKVASLMGMEGGHSINNSIATLRMFHRLNDTPPQRTLPFSRLRPLSNIVWVRDT